MCEDEGYFEISDDEAEQKWAVVMEDWRDRFAMVRVTYICAIAMHDEVRRLNFAVSQLGASPFTVNVIGPDELLFVPDSKYEVYEKGSDVPADRLVFRPEALPVVFDYIPTEAERAIVEAHLLPPPANMSLQQFVNKWKEGILGPDYTVKSAYRIENIATDYTVKYEAKKP